MDFIVFSMCFFDFSGAGSHRRPKLRYIVRFWTLCGGTWGQVEAHKAYVEVHKGQVEVHKGQVEVHRTLGNYRNPRKSFHVKVQRLSKPQYMD